MEKITYKNTLIAFLIRRFKNGSTPITNSSEPLQLMTHKHPQNFSIKAHIHTPKKRTTQKLQECLVVTKGKIKVDLYTANKKFFKYVYLSIGETLILINGGWAVNILKDCEFIEIKNGPFIEDKVIIE